MLCLHLIEPNSTDASSNPGRGYVWVVGKILAALSVEPGIKSALGEFDVSALACFANAFFFCCLSFSILMRNLLP